jgi:tRNA G18 (ribose-2'-O)-methylase SpoU
MANFIKIEDFSAPELDLYARLTGAQLRSRLEPEKAVFIAESPEVIRVAMAAGIEPISLLTDERLINSAVANIIDKMGEKPVYIATREVLSSLTGFALTRGALAAMKRPVLPSVEDVLKNAKRVAVLEEVADSTNIGALFRSAAALNIDAVLITPTCCDPLCRRAVRVSMGTVFQVPWTQIGEVAQDWPEKGLALLSKLGFKTVAMALTDESVSIDDEALMGEEKLAIILGTEGTGLKAETIKGCDYTAKIPMSHGVDSLNVACAGAVAFWQLGRRK